MLYDDHAKEFKKTIEQLARCHSLWQVWNDFLYMASASFANAMPFTRSEDVEKRYIEIISKYKTEEQEQFPKLLAEMVLSFERNPMQDFLGNMYHELNLHQKQKGQFFTPYHICEFMAEIQSEDSRKIIEEKGYISVNDPACGAGSMLIAYANVSKKNNINFQTQVLFVAQDIDTTAALMCYLQLTILGCSAIVIIGDSLSRPGFHPDNQVWYTPMYCLNYWRFKEITSYDDTDGEITTEATYDTVLSLEKSGQFSFVFDEAA